MGRTACHESTDNKFCMTYNRSLLVFDFIEKTLEEELLTVQEFEEEDIWFLIDSLVGALCYLQKNQLSHQNLKISTVYSVNSVIGAKLFKLADKELFNYTTLYEEALKHQGDPYKLKNTFLSPEQLILLKKKEKSPENMYNIYKSDVFTLGVMILQIALWKQTFIPYDYKNCVINQQLLDQYLHQVKQKYSLSLVEFLNLALNNVSTERPDFIKLNEYLDQSEQLAGKRIVQLLQPNQYSILLHINQAQAEQERQAQLLRQQQLEEKLRQEEELGKQRLQ